MSVRSNSSGSRESLAPGSPMSSRSDGSTHQSSRQSSISEHADGYSNRLSVAVGLGEGPWMSAFLHQAKIDRSFYDNQIIIANTRLLCCYPAGAHPPRLNCFGVRLRIALWNCDADKGPPRYRSRKGSRLGAASRQVIEQTEEQLRDLALAADQPPSDSIPDRHLVRAIAASRATDCEKQEFIDKMRSEPAFQKLVIARMDEYNDKGLNGLQFAMRSLMMIGTKTAGSERPRIAFSFRLLLKLIKEGAVPNLEHPDLPASFVLRQRAAQAISIVNRDTAKQHDDR